MANDNPPEAQQEESRAPFMDHLQELGKRIKRSIVAVLIGCVVAYIFSEQIFDFLSRPLLDAFRGEARLHFASPVEPFFTYLLVAVIGGLALAAPYIFYEIWGFVAPGLYPKEKRMAAPFLISSAVLFFGGIAFGYFLVFPLGFKFLLSYAYEHPGHFSLIQQVANCLNATVDVEKLHLPVASLVPTIMMQDYLSLAAKLLLAFGLIFELPIFIIFMAKIGLVTHRHLLKFARYFVVLSLLIGAILTPPDVITQVMMAVPLVTMYMLSTVAAFLITRARERREAESEAESEEETGGARTLEDLERSLPEDRWRDDRED